jgi:DNA polymerase elongation subunit (family B)
MKQAYKAGNKADGEKFHLMQHTMKILLNSLYGATALGSFRYGNVILSESITLSGQRIIQESALFANTHMNKVMKGEIEFSQSPQPKYQESGSIPNELKETIWDENSKNFRNLATHNFG